MINNINRDKSLVQKKSSKLCRHYTLKEVECKLSFLKWKLYALTLLRRIQFGRRKKSKFTVKKPDSQPGNQCQSEQWLLVLIYMYPWHGMMNKAFHLCSLSLKNHKPLQTWEKHQTTSNQGMFYKIPDLLLLLLSHFSRIRPFATP